MRIFRLTISFVFLSATGCGCLVEFGEKTGIRYPSVYLPDETQPAWDRWLSGPRPKRIGIKGGDRFFEYSTFDPDQPGWHSLLFGDRIIPRKMPDSPFLSPPPLPPPQ